MRIEHFKFIRPTLVNTATRYALGLRERATVAKVMFNDGTHYYKSMG